MKTILTFLLVATLFQSPQVRWAFPCAAMDTKQIAGTTAYNLKDGFWGIRMDADGLESARVILPTDLDKLITAANRSEVGAILDRDRFIVAAVIDKALATRDGVTHEYAGSGTSNGKRVYFFKTSYGGYVGGFISEDRLTVGLMKVPAP